MQVDSKGKLLDFQFAEYNQFAEYKTLTTLEVTALPFFLIRHRGPTQTIKSE